MSAALELLVETDGERVRLLAPDVGLFTAARPRGAVLTAGEAAGTLLALGRARTLVVPAGVAGTIVSPRPERVHHPVGYGALLYELAPLEAAAGPAAVEAPAATGAALALPAPQSGRFYHRPAPDEPAFVQPGDPLEEGRPVGLIEVMKTFAHVAYRSGGALPERARLVRYLVADGGEVSAGSPLLEVEPL